jgi:surfeit locus 1 family protein
LSPWLAHFGWRPSRIGTALVVLLLPTFIALGIWQLQRADSKRAQFAQFDSQADLPVLVGLPPDHSVPRYARVRVSGQFLPSQQFLLDNMTANSRNGYHVLTPFSPSGEDRLILVNRGWVRASGDRQTLPAVSVGAATRVISGQLDRLPRPGLALGGAGGQSSSWPAVVFFPQMEDLAAQLGRELYSYQLLLDPEQADGFLREWGPRSMVPEQHVGYAVQWFAFAVVLVIIYIGMSLRRGAL